MLHILTGRRWVRCQLRANPAAIAAVLSAVMYQVILNTALALGLDPDAPKTLSKVT